MRSRPFTFSSKPGTKDLQMVDITLRLLVRPEKTQLPSILKLSGPDYVERVFPSTGYEVLEEVVAEYNAEELLTQCSNFKKAFISKSNDFFIVIDDVSVTHMAFGSEFSKAVDNKVLAEKHQDAAEQERDAAKLEAETSKYLLLKAENDTKAASIRSGGLSCGGSSDWILASPVLSLSIDNVSF
ncbi:OLC1v1011713C1 [Oldenlandia corymbosa var. corymbosa]|uniref:Prohibitin n=1 Tax=Oldenlandia corymbosa var. corymbosa TaxID=529605 RepID=A0AAV1DUB9_OLDCO|nr:OLC1v1011713C1 [Oldenlandia corymbosa var. corymbosa]